MTVQAPLTITLYDPGTDEVLRTHTRMFVPWKVLKVAIKLSKGLDVQNMTPEDADLLAGLVVEVFGNKFSIEELNEGSDVGEMVSVINSIISRATGSVENPTPPG